MNRNNSMIVLAGMLLFVCGVCMAATTVKTTKSNTFVAGCPGSKPGGSVSATTVKGSKSNGSDRETTVKSSKSNSSDRATTVKGSKSNSDNRASGCPKDDAG